MAKKPEGPQRAGRYGGPFFAGLRGAEAGPKLTFFELVNKPVVIMLISTGLIGGLISYLTTQQQILKDRAAVQVELVRLQAEIQHRTWQLDLACAKASTAPDLTAAVGRVLGGQTVSDPQYKDVHLAAIISRFEMQSAISHDGKAYDEVRRLERMDSVAAVQVAEALRVMVPYAENRAKNLQEGVLPLKVRNFKDRAFLRYEPEPAPHVCGAIRPPRSR